MTNHSHDSFPTIHTLADMLTHMTPTSSSENPEAPPFMDSDFPSPDTLNYLPGYEDPSGEDFSSDDFAQTTFMPEEDPLPKDWDSNPAYFSEPRGVSDFNSHDTPDSSSPILTTTAIQPIVSAAYPTFPSRFYLDLLHHWQYGLWIQTLVWVASVFTAFLVAAPDLSRAGAALLISVVILHAVLFMKTNTHGLLLLSSLTQENDTIGERARTTFTYTSNIVLTMTTSLVLVSFYYGSRALFLSPSAYMVSPFHPALSSFPLSLLITLSVLISNSWALMRYRTLKFLDKIWPS